MIFSKFVAKFLFVILLVAPSKVYAYCDPGGNIHRYLDIIQREAIKPVSPLPSCCLSACTMRLALPRACVYPDKIVGFHSAHNGNGNLSPLWNNVLMASYQRYPKLQVYIKRNGYLNSFELKHLSGVDLNRMGVPYCSRYDRVNNRKSKGAK